MNCLVVANDFPWPPTYGTTLRSAAAIEAISRLGEIDLFTLTYPLRTDPCVVPPGLPIRRVKTLTGSAPDYSAHKRLKWLVSPRLPLELVAATPIPLKAEFFRWADKRYDLVFFSRAVMFYQLGKPKLGPTIVDLDDLEDQKIRVRLAAVRATQDSKSVRAFLHDAAALLQGHLNASRWHSLQGSVAGSADSVIVCSELDRDRSGLANAHVISNGYDAPKRPLGRDEVGNPPTMLLQGSLLYDPNADAARRLVHRILPLVRARLPEVRLRLVGEANAGVTKLDDRPAVTVVGRAESMEPELAGADLVAAPIRYGSGTRIKILEAFAHRIPVVTTSIGAEGLGLQTGRHCLLADDDEGFAQACIGLLTQPDLRRKLVSSAHQLFLDSYQWSSSRDQLEAMARLIASDSGVNRGH